MHLGWIALEDRQIGLVVYELETLLEDGLFVAERLLPDGTGGHVIEAPCAAGVVDEGLAGLIGGLDDGVADAAGALLG